MKNSFIVVLLPLLAVFASCNKDLGNYDYHDINELAISGLEASYSRITSVDTLHIDPVIAMTETEPDGSRFDYFWIAKQGNTVIDTIGRQKALDYRVTLNPDTYTLHFRVLDKETDVIWKTNTTLHIGTPYSRGIMLIGEDDNGFAEAEMLSMLNDTLHVRGILSQSGLPPMKDPINLVHTGISYAKLWVFTGSGSYYIDRMTMKGSESDRFGRLIYTTDPIQADGLTPIFMAPQIRDISGAVSSNSVRAMLCSDGNIFASYMALNGGDYYSNPINRVSNDMETLLKAAPYLLYPIGNMSSMMWYDTDNQRFMNYGSFILRTFSDIPQDALGDIFPWDQAATGRTLVYAENTRNTDGGSTNGNSFAIMKDGNNGHFIYKFYANGATPAKRSFYTVLPLATDFDKADFYAFSSRRTVVFYAVGNRLYAYDYNPGNERIYQFPEIGTDEISMLKFDTQINYLTNSLYIATYNAGTKGTLQRFEVGTNPDVVELISVENARWSNLIKVKNMSWRAVN